MATNMEGSLLATGGVLTIGEFEVGEIAELRVNTSDTYTWDYTTTDGRDNSNDIHIVTPFEFDGTFEMTPAQAEEFVKILYPEKQPVVEKKRVIPKHRMIRED